MRALTLTQPWASLVIWGEKWLETRSWATAYRGPLVIHAAKAIPRDVMEMVKGECLDSEGYFWAAFQRNFVAYPTGLPRGSVLGTVELVNCVPVERVHVVRTMDVHRTEIRHGEYLAGCQDEAFGDFSPGRFAWVMERPAPFEKPIPARGALGVWDWQPPAETE